MRPTTRLLAIVSKNAPLPKGSGQYLAAYTPTGLTGLSTHPYPRPTLLHLYNATLSKLSAFPQHSVYRQSVEALTKQRLAVISEAVPPGFEEWQGKMKEQLAQHPEIADRGRSFKTLAGETYMLPQEEEDTDDRVEEWDGESTIAERGEGPRTVEERKRQAKDLGEGRQAEDENKETIVVVNEPPLTTDQINAIEVKIAAGLIEEVIMVAKAELELVETMLDHQVWEELEEKPAEDQWSYFPRDRHTGTTQGPPQ